MKLTIVYPCYNQQQPLLRHIAVWNQLPEDIRLDVEFIIVDDCSTKPIVLPNNLKLNIRLYRIDTDIPWNYGAKNLGVQKANSQWVFLSELDHMLTPSFTFLLVDIATSRTYNRTSNYFMFHRTQKPKPHPATYLFDTRNFWLVNGIDEDFSGAYGHDDTYLVACFERAGVSKIIPEHMRLDCSLEGDEESDAEPGQLSHISKNTTRNDELLARKLQNKHISTGRIRFNWELVHEYRFAGVFGSTG